MEIKNEQIQETYIQGKLVFYGSVSLSNAARNVAQKTSMNEASARDYINTLQKLIKGKSYTRTINAYGTEYFLSKIHEEFDRQVLLNAVASVKKHLQYYQGVGKSSQPKIQGILHKYQQLSNKAATAEALFSNFQNQVEQSLSDTRTDRQDRLKSAPVEVDKIEVKTTVFLRNPDVVADVIDRAMGVCERCRNPAPFIRAKDGTPYLEVHHKTLLSNGGEDTVENAIALCPNCHRELHYGIQPKNA
jgi:5-methylcytosine-specific restriction protein A